MTTYWNNYKIFFKTLHDVEKFKITIHIWEIVAKWKDLI